MYDIIIIGAGPAGISAGIYAVSRGKKTLILEKNKVGGIIGGVSTVTHYTPVAEGETGAAFAERMERQARAAGVNIAFENVTKASLTGGVKKIYTERGVYEAKRVIIASGSAPRKLGIAGEAEFAGRGIGLNAARDGEKYRGKNMYVVGGADGAVKEALYLSRFAAKLTVVHFEEKLGCIPEFAQKVAQTPNIALKLSSRLTKVSGKDCVDELEFTSEKDGSKETVLDCGCGVFVYAGTVPNTDIFGELKTQGGYIPVNGKMETEIAGVYAAGDVTVKQVRQIATAVSDGAIAAINATASL